MIIEIFGLPGVGKTSFSRAWVGADKKYKNIKVTSRLELVFLNLFYFLRYPKKFIVSLFLVIKYSGGLRLMYSKFMNLFLQYNARFIKAESNGLSILDQGHMMSTLSLFEQDISSHIMMDVYSNINRSDALVILEASDDIRHSRLEKRGYGVRENISQEYGQAFLDIMEGNYPKVMKLINADRGFKKVVVNTNSMSSEQIVQSVKKNLGL